MDGAQQVADSGHNSNMQDIWTKLRDIKKDIQSKLLARHLELFACENSKQYLGQEI